MVLLKIYSHQLRIIKREDFKFALALSRACPLYNALKVPLEISISTEFPDTINDPITLPDPFNFVVMVEFL